MFKKFIITSLILLFPTICQAKTCQVVQWGSNTWGSLTNVGSAEYNSPMGDGTGAWDSNVDSVYAVAPTGFTVDMLKIKLNGAVGSGDSVTWTLYVEGSTTALTTTISGSSETEDQDTTNSVHVDAQDLIAFQATGTGTPTVWGGSLSYRICADIEGETIFLFSDPSDHGSGLTTGMYMSPWGNGYDDSSSDQRAGLFPMAGTLKKFHYRASDALAAGETSNLDIGGLGCTLDGDEAAPADQECQDMSTEVDIAAGDNYDIHVTLVNGPFPNEFTSGGMVFVPDVPGQFIVGWNTDGTVDTATTYYASMNGGDRSPNSNEYNARSVAPVDYEIHGMYARHDEDLGGASDSVMLTLRSDGADAESGFEINITGSDAAGSEHTDTPSSGVLSISAGEELSTEMNPNDGGTLDTSGGWHVSYIGYIKPTLDWQLIQFN